MGSGIVMMKQYPSLSIGLDVSSELHPEASTELHRTKNNSHFHHASEMG
jgi:hypothetical protein